MRMRILLPPRPLLFRAYHNVKSTSIMSASKQHEGQNKPKPKNPPLTHFLCLPLVNSVSLPQLESSLASFKASIPSAFPSKSDQREQQQSALIPDAAIRPVGTLHLTLGVMSLPTPERLEEALRFFHSLDLAALLRTAAANAAQKRLRASTKRVATPIELTEDSGDQGRIASQTTVSTDQSLATISTEEPSQDESATPRPFTISLESLHVLPRARTATVLHATPIDPTSRLYPFCEALRDKFLEAGFLQGEYKTEPRQTPRNQEGELQNTQHDGSAQGKPDSTTAMSTDKPAGEEPTLLEGMPAVLAKETAQPSNPPTATAPSQPPTSERKGKTKPRPLLLHATVVNTIYIRGRKRKPGGHGKKARNDRYTFDARDILSHYKSFYLDSERTIPRSSGGVITSRESEVTNNGNDGPNTQESPAAKENADAQSGKGETISAQLPSNNDVNETGYPFVWARNFPIEAVCICEMGAKKLDPHADDSGMNARLGEQYTVVAERSLSSWTMEQRAERYSMAESDDESVVEGGVKVSA